MKYSLELLDVSKNIKGSDILCDVNVKLEKGHIYGLVGANGSGKSTLLKMIMGLYQFKGKIYINSFDIKKNYKEALKDISGLVDYVSLYNFLTASENLRYFAIMYGVSMEEVSKVAKMCKIDLNNKRLVKTYSLGMKQRLGIAIGLLKNPEILVLDEPTNGLDPKGIKDLRELLLSFKDKTIIISSHLISEIDKITGDILFINNNRLMYKRFDEETDKKYVRFKVSDYIESYKSINLDLNKPVFMDEIEVSSTVKKLTKDNIDVYRIAEESNLENMIISMMGEEDDKTNKR